MFSDAVGGGMSSRLFQQVREDSGPRLFRLCDAPCRSATAGLFSVYAATARRESAAAAAADRGDRRRRPPTTLTQREVDRVRTQAKAGLLMSIESPWGQAHYVARQLSSTAGWSSRPR